MVLRGTNLLTGLYIAICVYLDRDSKFQNPFDGYVLIGILVTMFIIVAICLHAMRDV
jgi:hypothetical protein